MAILLLIDTSSDLGLFALVRDGVCISVQENTESRNHAAAINLLICELMTDAGFVFTDLDAVAVCAGPGSYTGLRIGMATAKGLCYALDKPLLLDNRLTLLAYQAYQNHGAAFSRYASLLLARQGEYFITVHDSHFNCIIEPRHIHENELAALLEKNESTYIVTDVTNDVLNSLELSSLQIGNDIKIDCQLWAKHAFEQFKCNSFVNLSSSEPFYLKQVYTHK